MGGKHEVQGQNDGDAPGKQLGKAQQQAVGQLIHVGDYPLHQVAGAVAVQVRQGQLLDLPDGFAADVPHRPVGQLVIDQVHGPGGKG